MTKLILFQTFPQTLKSIVSNNNFRITNYISYLYALHKRRQSPLSKNLVLLSFYVCNKYSITMYVEDENAMLENPRIAE